MEQVSLDLGEEWKEAWRGQSCGLYGKYLRREDLRKREVRPNRIARFICESLIGFDGINQVRDRAWLPNTDNNSARLSHSDLLQV